MAKSVIRLTSNSRKIREDLDNFCDVQVKKVVQVTKDLAREGARNAQATYDEYSDFTGVKPKIKVRAEKNKNNKGWNIVARGPNIDLIEYGTGVYSQDYSGDLPPRYGDDSKDRWWFNLPIGIEKASEGVYWEHAQYRVNASDSISDSALDGKSYKEWFDSLTDEDFEKYEENFSDSVMREKRYSGITSGHPPAEAMYNAWMDIIYSIGERLEKGTK